MNNEKKKKQFAHFWGYPLCQAINRVLPFKQTMKEIKNKWVFPFFFNVSFTFFLVLVIGVAGYGFEYIIMWFIGSTWYVFEVLFLWWIAEYSLQVHVSSGWQELPAEPRQNGHPPTQVQKKKSTVKGYHDDSDDVSWFDGSCAAFD